MVPVGHQLPGGEAQRPGGLGDQAGDGTRKQFAGGDVPEERLLLRLTVGSRAHRSPQFCFFVFFGSRQAVAGFPLAFVVSLRNLSKTL